MSREKTRLFCPGTSDLNWTGKGLTSETCWALYKEIIKQVTSSWSLFTQLHMICISSNNVRHPVTKTSTTLHPATLHSTSLYLSTLHFLSFKLHPTTLHYPLIWLNSISVSYRSIWPHITTLHLTSLHCTFRWFSPHFYSFHFTQVITAFLTLFLKILGLKGKVPNASAGSWFQFLMVLFTKEYFPISILCFLSLIFQTWSTLLK